MLASVASMFILGVLDVTPWHDVVAMAGGGALVAIIGFIDDHRHLSAAWRLISHFVAAIWLLAWLGSDTVLRLGSLLGAPGLLAEVFVVLYVVWVLNLTNFMDGIDGLAATEAATVCGAGALLTYVAVPHASLWLLPLVIAAAAVGFFMWNRPPARIFMGDAGSGFLGFMFAALAVQISREAPVLFWCWTILLGVFIVDATTTLVRRLLHGEDVSSAHRSHAYQHAAVRWAAHGPVTAVAASINIVWLFPIAWFVAARQVSVVAGLLVAYAPLIVLAIRLGAGLPGQQRA